MVETILKTSLEIALNILVVAVLPFLTVGIIRKTKAFWGGRRGASIFQPLYDFIKLTRKGFVISNSTSFVFKMTPVVYFAATLVAALFTPLITGHAVLNIEAGLIIFAYILGLSKFFALIGAMDTASSFEGMGASREACFTSIVEPAFFIIMGSIMALSGNFTFESLSKIISLSGGYGVLIGIFTVLALFLMVLIEGCRVPVDDPATHLELTMIHEVMILDNSGFDLALISYAASLKMLLISSFIAKILIPSGFSLYPVCYLAVIALISIVIGTVESSMARIRMSHVFEFIFIMSTFALVILSLIGVRMFGG